MSNRCLIVLLFSTIILSCNGVSDSDPSLPDPTWRKIDAKGIFTFHIPPGFEAKDVQGIDSYVGVFESPTMKLTFDYGWYSGLPHDQGQPGYEKKETQINGRKALIVSYQPDSDATNLDYKHFIAVHFPAETEDRETGINELTMSAFCKSPKDISTARAIFESVHFQ